MNEGITNSFEAMRAELEATGEKEKALIETAKALLAKVK